MPFTELSVVVDAQNVIFSNFRAAPTEGVDVARGNFVARRKMINQEFVTRSGEAQTAFEAFEAEINFVATLIMVLDAE